MEPGDDDELGRLAAVARVHDRDLAADAALQAALAELRGGITAAGRPWRLKIGFAFRRSWFGRHTVAVGAAFATALVLLGAVVLTQLRPAPTLKPPRPTMPPVTSTPAPAGPPLHTGEFPADPSTEEDPSEWLNLDSPQLPAYVDQAGKAIPLPPKGDWSYAKKSLAGTGRMQATGVTQTLVLQSICQWGYYWRDARRREDQQAERRARRMIEGAATWRFTGVDPRTGRTWSYSRQLLERPVDDHRIQQELAVNCTPRMWPGAHR